MLCSCLLGCASVSQQQHETVQDENAELRSQLERSDERLAQFQLENQRARQEIASLEKQVAGQREVQQILDQRVQNLHQENDRLNREMSQLVITAAGAQPNSLLRNVGGPRHLEFELPSALARELEVFATQNTIQFDQKDKVCRFSSRRMFDASGDRLLSWSRDTLKKLAEILQRDGAADLNLLIVGHTAASPEFSLDQASIHPTDWHLGVHQAIAVEQYLEECGIPPARMGVISYAGHQPLHDDHDPRNARLEIYLVSPDPVGGSSDQ